MTKSSKQRVLRKRAENNHAGLPRKPIAKILPGKAKARFPTLSYAQDLSGRPQLRLRYSGESLVGSLARWPLRALARYVGKSRRVALTLDKVGETASDVCLANNHHDCWFKKEDVEQEIHSVEVNGVAIENITGRWIMPVWLALNARFL